MHTHAIIGITGTIGAGKGTVVEYLKSKSFHHYSAREFITREILARGLPVNRDSMAEVANDLRARHGSDYVAVSLYEEAERTGGDCVIESIRTVGEIEALRSKPDFRLFAVDADQAIRYQRIVARGSETDQIDFVTFQANEAREMDNRDPAKQNLRACIALADAVLKNDGTFEELFAQVDRALFVPPLRSAVSPPI